MTVLLALQIIASGMDFTCTPARVESGLALLCEEGPRVLLAGLTARRPDGSCPLNQPCSGAAAIDARDYLVSLVGERLGPTKEGDVLVRGEPMTCTSIRPAAGSTTIAWCVQPDLLDLSCAMVESGLALRREPDWRDRPCIDRPPS